MKKYFCCLLSYLFSTSLFAQHNFPKGDFILPMKVPLMLAGSFAECRPDHFHTGIDIKTDNKENIPVLAAADGYISRIAISHKGYGNALYIVHPNGYTTVYGHLNDFAPELMQYVKQQQYAQQKWNIDIKLEPNQFPFNQGQQIAYSGNTGGSTAPHLHFEIRNTQTEIVHNPLFFGFNIKDNVAPSATSVAFYDAENYYSVAPQFVSLKKISSNQYTFSQEIVTLHHPNIFVGIDAKDYMNGSTNWLGIASMELIKDNESIANIEIAGIDFAQNRAVNAYGDYRTFKEKGNWFHGLYRLKNNPLEVYPKIKNNGAIDLSDGQAHNLKIIMKDALGNTSTVTGKVKYSGKIAAKKDCNNLIEAQKGFVYQHPSNNLFIKMPNNVLYDDVCFTIKETSSKAALSHVFDIINTSIPAQNYFELGIKINKLLPLQLRSKLVFIHKIPKSNLPGSNSQNAQAVRFEKGFAVGSVRSFGNYYVKVDTVAPKITILKKGENNMLQFKVSEETTNIKSFDVFVDGQWVCCTRKGDTFTYIFDEKIGKGKHELKAKAGDDNDNERVVTTTFERIR